MRAFAHFSTVVLCAVAPELANYNCPPILPDRGRTLRTRLQPLTRAAFCSPVCIAPASQTVVEWDECASSSSSFTHTHTHTPRSVRRVRFDVRLMQRVPVLKTWNPKPPESLFRSHAKILIGFPCACAVRRRLSHADIGVFLEPLTARARAHMPTLALLRSFAASTAIVSCAGAHAQPNHTRSPRCTTRACADNSPPRCAVASP